MHDAIQGWTCQSTDTLIEDRDFVQGRVIQVEASGSWSRELHIAQTDDSIAKVELDAEKCEGLKPWMTLKGARKLICVGVSVRVHRQESLVVRVVLTGALPSTSYLARLLSFPIENLAMLFSQPGDTDATLVDLACALRPCSVDQVKQLCQFCASETESGRFSLLFKHQRLLELCDKIREVQGWSRGPNKAPTTSTQTWSALLRMEHQWCQECKQEENETMSTLPEIDRLDRLVFNAVDVDPSLNIPNPTDQRRIRYIEERKRPQVLWMLNLINRMVESTKKETVCVVDIGGGRGDLANAVAAYFAQPDQRVTAHVVVLDVNESSLNAGKARAEAARIGGHMSFSYCDLGRADNVESFLQRHPVIDLVFGLHCCGGLSEAAVELALRCGAKFAISTCCFRSNEQLSTLSQLAEKMAATDEFRSDRNLLTTLAVIGGAQGQERAIRTLNYMRMSAAKKRFGEGGRSLQTWQESFPSDFSEQNCVMVGSPNSD